MVSQGSIRQARYVGACGSVANNLKGVQMTDDLNELAKLWLNTKVQEKKLTEERRKIEDRIKSLAGIPENLDGTEIVSPPGYEIKIAGRIDRKVDANKLQEIAEMNDMIDHLSTLFRWTPDVNVGL